MLEIHGKAELNLKSIYHVAESHHSLHPALQLLFVEQLLNSWFKKHQMWLTTNSDSSTLILL